MCNLYQLNELAPEDHSSEIKNKAFFNSKQINENVKLEEIVIVEVDASLNDPQKVYLKLLVPVL